MPEILQFIFSNFWVFLGTWILLDTLVQPFVVLAKRIFRDKD